MLAPLLAPVLAVALEVTALADETPEPEDVKAGWLAFAVFGLLIAAMVVLFLSLVKRLRNVDRAEDEGKYDHADEPGEDRPDA